MNKYTKIGGAMRKPFSLRKSRHVILNRVFRKCFPEKVTLEQRPKDDNVCCYFYD